MTPVPFVDLAVGDASERAELLAAIDKVLQRGDYVLGRDVGAFEREFAAYCGASFAIGVSSGTTALVLALRALDIRPGDEVITVANSFLSTVSSILLAGARPVLVDVADDENIDVAAVEAAISPRVRAVLPVHLRGRPAPLDALVCLARAHGLRVVEDASQAQGARIGGRHAGTFGDLGCFSLHPLKNLPALGDAGVVVTDDADLAQRLRLLRNHGLAERGLAVVLGDTARLDSVQAAVLRVRLARLDEANARRRRIADVYDEAFAGLPVVLPPRTDDVKSVYHHYVIRVDDRPSLLQSLQADGVDARVHYEVPAHRQPAFASLVNVHGELPRTTAQAQQIVSLPCHPAMPDEQVRAVVDAVLRHYLSNSGRSLTSHGARPSAAARWGADHDQPRGGEMTAHHPAAPGFAVLPLDRLDAVIFDTDGVLTDTASVHAATWKRLFDEYLRGRVARLGEPFRPFENEDFLRHVDGRSRMDGVAGFLTSRGITLPEGTAGDPPELETVGGLGNRKNGYFLAALADGGARPFPSSRWLVRALRARGVRVAAVSASRNFTAVLQAARLHGLFDAEVDGVDTARLGLPGKPDPALFLEAAARLGVPPARAAVVEDARAGVEAGWRGGFALVVGVDRAGQADELKASGADVVVGDLGEIRLAGGPAGA